jgi:hypothetical protein
MINILYDNEDANQFSCPHWAENNVQWKKGLGLHKYMT